jgi:hypothetical protein
MKLSVASIQEINRLHDEIWESARTATEKAIRIGELLAKQKALSPHGEWLPWLRKNVQFSQSTAWRYMQIFERREGGKLFTLNNLTEAYVMLFEPDPSQSEQVTTPEPINEPEPTAAKAVTSLRRSFRP